jgi:hypothetical protein
MADGQEAVDDVGRIMDVAARRLEVGRRTVALLVEMQAVPARRQALDVHPQNHAACALGDRRAAHVLACRALQVDGHGGRRGERGEGDGGDGEDDRDKAHGKTLLQG